MEDFGQIVAIIIGIIVVAVNAATKKKKPNKGKPSPASPPPVQKTRLAFLPLTKFWSSWRKTFKQRKLRLHCQKLKWKMLQNMKVLKI